MLAVGVGAALLTVWATAHGAGLTSDSATYLAGADRLRDQPADLLLRSVPIGRADLFPPLHPWLVALLAPVAGSVVGAARLLGVLVALAVPVLAHAVVRPAAGDRRALVAATVLVLSDGLVVLLAGQAMADGVFLVLALVAVLAYQVAGRRSPPSTGGHVVVGGLAALACLARLTGVALVLALAVGTLAAGGPGRGRRVAAVVAPPVLALGVWSVTRDDVGGRAVVWHPPSGADLRLGLENVAKWVLPEGVVGRAPAVVALGVAVGLVVLAGVTVRRQVRAVHGGPLDRAAVLELVLVTWAMAQVVTVVGARVVLDANLPLDQRLLFPAWAAGVLAAAVASRDLHPAGWSRSRRGVTAGAVALLAIGMLGQLGVDTRAAHTDGQGYATPAWADSATMAAVTPGPARATNAPDAVYLRRGLVLDGLPTRYDTTTGRPDPSYRAGLAALVAAVRAEQGSVYWFDAVDRPSLPTLADLEDAGLVVTRRLDDGVILG